MKSFVYLFTLLVSLNAQAFDHGPDRDIFEAYVDKMMSHFKVPGVAVGIVNKDKVIYLKGFGVRSIGEQKSVTPETQFAIGSTTKAFTSTALGILVDRKVLDWDKPIKSAYLPDFELYDPVASELTTTRDLLSHRTGLPRHDLVWYGTPFSRESLYGRLKYLKPSVTFREKTQYQNLMYMTAGYMTGKLTGMSWESFIEKEIFLKLDMNNSTFSVLDMQNTHDFAVPHRLQDDEIVEIPFRNLDAVAPAGSINSSVSDMAKWLQLQLNHGITSTGERIVQESTLRELYKANVVSELMGFDKLFPELSQETYAMGWFNQLYLGEKLIHHGGGIDGFITFVGFLPDRDTGIVVFGNSESLIPYFIGFGYLDLMIKGEIGPWQERLDELMKKKTVELVGPTDPPVPLTNYVGVYSHPAYGEISIQLNDEGGLAFTHYSTVFQLKHYDKNSFLNSDDAGMLIYKVGNKKMKPIEFYINSANEINGLFFSAEEGIDPIEFVRVGQLRADSLYNWEVLLDSIPRQSESLGPLQKRLYMNIEASDD